MCFIVQENVYKVSKNKKNAYGIFFLESILLVIIRMLGDC